MNERDRGLLLDLRKKIPVELAKHIQRLLVFGSRARGESTKDSDLDVLVLVDEKTPDIVKRLEDIAYQIMWDHDFMPIISLKVIESSKYNNALNKGFSFYKYIEKEGIAVLLI
jgi:uncharacterized protein